MGAAAQMTPVFSREELDLIVELLERERAELPAEIHRTRTVEVRDQLRRRLEMVNRLIERLCR
ncbi:MAG: hypothetical protein ACP5U2_07905 [Bryobacteraceae bacterium]